MKSKAWIKLFRLIPPALLDQLMIVTGVGQEISLQSVLRLEDDYTLVRGRLAGTTETDRFFFVPYDQINYIGFQRPMKEEVVLSLFNGTPVAAAPVVQAPAPVAPLAVASPPPAVAPHVEAAPPPPEPLPPNATPLAASVEEAAAKNAHPSRLVNRAALLQLIRARSQSAATPNGTGGQ